MTWFEIKKAAEEAGIEDNEEICEIACETDGGSKTLKRMVIGRTVKLAETHSTKRGEASGCAT